MDDLSAPIVEEEEISAPEGDETPAPVLSIREELGAALLKSKEAKVDSEPKDDKPKVDRTRAEDGKFAKPSKAQREVKQPIATAIPPEGAQAEIKMPKSLSQNLQADWMKLPRPLQEQLAKREDDYHKELTKHDEERNFGREITRVVTPYMAQIRAEGADAPKAIQELLNTAHLLRTASPQQKGALLWRTAQMFGADMRQNQAQPPVNPMLQGLQQQVHSLQQTIQQQTELKKQQEDDAIQSQIKTFSEDPKNIHFEAVKAEMAALLKSGLAKDLPDAYERATYANPHTRSTLLQAQTTGAEEKRVAEKRAKAEAAKKAGSSLRGSPGIAATKNGKITQSTLRGELEAAFATHSQG